MRIIQEMNFCVAFDGDGQYWRETRNLINGTLLFQEPPTIWTFQI